ncbi:Multidrug resistance ABC transporter ATP-binding/permease protein BmrA [Paenibacillus solanacearum]|uniref:Multidrug resistance ABC transporter ATP-binding/permease protein BmrA n=1 Tax=Paenibacillus solanacearum TaxID=2048548 RepID=A0A916K3B1_9BACL|nr:ABC transporter ATP-binding protein [Paenibacillus solanacearum]CAG7619188.1 Multidrug resistance ABC transporter ATP-binding/permease protein BmrA [Paenibacillus solanacearum]
MFLKLIRETKPPFALLAIALLMSVATTVAGLAVPLLTKGLVDQGSISSLTSMQIAGMVAVFLVQAITGAFSVYTLNHIGQRVVASLRERLWRKLLALPVAYYDEHASGEAVSRMTNDTAVVKGLITEHLSGFVTGIISIVGSIGILLYLDWKMTLMLLLTIPLAVAIFLPLGRQMHRISKNVQNETAGLTAVLSRVLSEIRLVKASNAESREYEAGNAGIRSLFRFGLKEARVQALIMPIIGLILMLLLVLVIGYGGWRVSTGSLTAGALTAFLLYLFQIVMPVGQLTQFFTQWQKALGATEMIMTALQEEEEHPGSGAEIRQLHQTIAIEGLSFGYKPDEPVLKDISFAMEPGKVTAIVGPSGSGKTTLFSLIERFYEPQRGAIRLGSTPIGEFSLRDWRSRIGYVSQESPLIAGTVRDNLCYGLNRTVSEEELDRAARMAYADHFIRELPQGYDTEVGERGMKLSGGQRQRLSIARAILRNPQWLMLDEATSSLDSKSEIVVQQALDNLMKGRTTLVIAHRLATVVHADQIVFIDKGTVTGIGTHEELYRSHAMYREFADHQLKIREASALLPDASPQPDRETQLIEQG